MEKIVDTGFEYLKDQMAEPFVGGVIEKIIYVGFEYLKGQVRWQMSMKEELQRLQKIYPEIQRVVAAPSQSQIRDQNPDLDRWLWQLRDAVEEADDLLDEFEYLKHKEQLRSNCLKGKKHSITSFLIESCNKIRKVGQRALKMDRNFNRLVEMVQKLVNVSADVAKYSDLFETKKQKMLLELNDIRKTGALPTKNFVGRFEEMESIMQWLRNSSNEDQSHNTSSNLYKNISLLSIVGHGGMGKTTLSRHAYDNGMTNEFDVKMWVCVSTNFDVKRVIAGMLESHKKSKCGVGSLKGLQKRLKSKVMAKKFLLVLDDIWEDEEKDKSKWEKVFAPLSFGSLGSKILVTTRMDSVASMIANVLSSKDHTTLRLEGMKDDECLELLYSQAFATIENPDAHKKSILEQIVKKVLGSPLAAKVIGDVLSDDIDVRHWRKVLNSDIGSIEQAQNIFFPILRLSYIFLPKRLQSCFSFCSVFQQDHWFDKDDLIRMWIALNFIQPSSNPRERLEDIGERYFDILVKKSFFEKFQETDYTYYKMHNLLYELTRFVSARECCRVVGDKELSSCETIRHLSVETDDLEVLRKIKKCKKLRSLFLSCDIGNHKDFADVLSEIFKASSSIRLLFINARYQMPETIGDLIHLRYLKCDNGGNVTQLPRSICNLYHMYFIIYDSCAYNFPCDFLPRDMNNLFNLRYAKLPWKRLPKMHWIGELQPLQKLNNFFVKNEVGYKINELEHMNKLCRLRIYQLENVKDVEESCNAKFCDKGSLTKLSLQWGDNTGHRNIVHINLDEEVFDNLQPHNNLKRLTINAYMGTRSARWMNDVKFISNLERIKLEGCLEWQTLPPFGQLHFLKSLYLRKMPKVKSIDYRFHRKDKDCAFPSLEVLHIVDLDALEDWFDAAAASDDCLFPCLAELHLKDCPNLQEPPTLPPKLKELKIDNIGWKSFISLQGISNLCSISIKNCSNQISLRGHEEVNKNENIQPMASNLVVEDPSVSNQIYLGGHEEVDKSENIQPMASNLVIKDPSVSNQISLGGHEEVDKSENIQPMASILVIKDPSVLLMEPLRSITSLEKLTIKHNDELVSFPIEAEKWFLQVRSSLRELNFKWLITLHSLPSFLKSLSSLKILNLEHVPQLRQLSDIPASLERLELSHLRSLQCLPSSLSNSSLSYLSLTDISVQKLPILPASLCVLKLDHLEYLDCLPSLSSLQMLFIRKVSQLRKLPDLPPSLRILALEDLKNLDCLPSCPFDLSSIQEIFIDDVPRLRKLPDLPPSLEKLSVYNCHPELMECYRRW